VLTVSPRLSIIKKAYEIENIQTINEIYATTVKDILCHDFKVIVDHYINSQISQGKSHLNKLAMDFKDRLERDSNIKIEVNLENNLFNHGLLSAINMMNYTQKIRDSLSQDKVLGQILRAIALHNIDEYKNITFNDDPLSFLLILSDELQEWGRQILIDDDFKSSITQINLNLEPHTTGGLRIPEDLKIEFICSDVKSLTSTGWDYATFCKSKNIAFDRINFLANKDKRIHPVSLQYYVRVPSNIFALSNHRIST
jgi:hypothetical protein